VKFGRDQLIPALHIARGNEQLILTTRLGRTGEFAKSSSIEISEEQIMVVLQHTRSAQGHPVPVR
jgi:hypothetical protein